MLPEDNFFNLKLMHADISYMFTERISQPKHILLAGYPINSQTCNQSNLKMLDVMQTPLFAFNDHEII